MLTIKEKKILENYIYKIAKATIAENKVSLREDENGEEKGADESTNKKRARVVSWLKKDELNGAAIMRQLWHPTADEEDGARSYFYKCRDNELNDNGIPYQFKEEEINKLYQIMTQSGISK